MATLAAAKKPFPTVEPTVESILRQLRILNFAIIDVLCHAWDIAASVGDPIEFPPAMST